MTLPPEDLPPVATAAYQQLNDDQKLAFPGPVRDHTARVANKALAAVGQSGVEELPAAGEEE